MWKSDINYVPCTHSHFHVTRVSTPEVKVLHLKVESFAKRLSQHVNILHVVLRRQLRNQHNVILILVSYIVLLLVSITLHGNIYCYWSDRGICFSVTNPNNNSLFHCIVKRGTQTF